MSILLIIDGDVLCYQACKARWQTKVQYQTVTSLDGEEQEVPIIELDEDGKRKSLEYTKEEDAKYLRECLDNVKKDFQELCDRFYATDVLMGVKGEDNFRNLMYEGYKMNRHKDPNKQNSFVPILRKLLVHEELAVEAHGREADDLMRVWAEEARSKGIDFIICSIDKDLRCIPGKHYNMKKQELTEVSEEDAHRLFYEQLLKGDPTDNIPGIPRVGDVKAKRLLADVSVEDEFQYVVVDEYMKAYGDEWLEYLLANGKMLYLQKDMNDYFCCSHWDIIRSINGD
jgi:5'-3' exonuclease